MKTWDAMDWTKAMSKKKIKRENTFDKTANLREGGGGEEGGLIRGHYWNLFLSPLAFLFAETVNVHLQCISCFKKVHPWVFAANYLISKIVNQLKKDAWRFTKSTYIILVS